MSEHCIGELKPCPFCGGQSEVRRCGHLINDWYHVHCPHCGVSQSSYGCDGKKDAIQKWNTRADGWISVKDELPKNNLERVLVLLKDDTFTIHLGLNKIDTDRCIDGKWVRWSNHVTCWQPLPESLKGESV